jgi:hypothetical protein
VRPHGHRLLWIILLILSLGSGSTASGASGPTTFTVHVSGGSTKTSLRLQPGFATVLRADHRVDTVAIGDPRLVTATTVKRGPDVYDLVLQPQTSTGITNMIVWFGDLTSIWDLTVGPGRRTADIVYVVTAPPAAASNPAVIQTDQPPAWGKDGGATPPPSTAAPAQRPSPGTGGGAPTSPSPTPRGSPTDDASLEAQQRFGDVTGVFQLSRGRGTVKIRYRLTNQSATDFSIRPNGVLLRVNGRLVPFGMTREHVDRDRPGVLPAGTTETGSITAPVKAPRTAEVIFSLFPAEAPRQGPSRSVPTTFQLMFAGLERLSAANTP